MKRLFHVSEQPGIEAFVPRPSPSFYQAIDGDVVFAIEDRLLHNYLLPRHCPRVTYYAGANTNDADKEAFFGESDAAYVINIEPAWYETVKNITLYCYEFLPDDFFLLDDNAGYYISYQTVKPIAVKTITDCMTAMRKRNVELRFVPDLTTLANAVRQSTLHFSLIRMRNAGLAKI